MRARLLCLAVVLGATSLVPAASWGCDSTGCLLLTRGQNGVMAKGTWRVDLSLRNTDQSDPRRGGDPATLVLRPKIYFEQERVIWFYKLDLDPGVMESLPGGWRDVDYLIASPAIRADPNVLPSVGALLTHSDVVASFGTGDDRIEIRKINKEEQ